MVQDGNQVSQSLADSIVTGIWQTAAANGHYDGLRAAATPAQREQADAAMDRHAGRQRRAGKAGW